ncbi:unnamed protein product [Camellia sinensis]
MAEAFDYDTCLGFKRRISQLSDIKIINQPTLLEDQHSNSLSPEPQQQPSEIVSSSKAESETENGLLKKPKCASSNESEPKVVEKKQETEEEEEGNLGDEGELDCRLVNEKKKELKDCEVGFSGNREFVESKKSSCSRLSVKEVYNKHSVVEDWNKCLATSCVAFDENQPVSFLKSKQESIADVMIHVSKFTNFHCKRENMGGDASIKINKELDNSLRVVDGNGSVCEGMYKIGERVEKVGGLKGNCETKKCSVKIEVIDETAVIEMTSVCKIGNGIRKVKKGFVGFAKHSERNVKKNVMKQERDGKKEKMPQRREKGAKKMSGTNGKDKLVQNCREKKGDEAKTAYSREEMEALKFVNLEAQRKMWIEAYCGLAPTVAREYDGLIDSNHQKHTLFSSDTRQQFGKKEMTSGVLEVWWLQREEGTISKSMCTEEEWHKESTKNFVQDNTQHISHVRVYLGT